mgnify:CR=1 FL=1|jgi:hypothetical protein
MQATKRTSRKLWESLGTLLIVSTNLQSQTLTKKQLTTSKITKDYKITNQMFIYKVKWNKLINLLMKII